MFGRASLFLLQPLYECVRVGAYESAIQLPASNKYKLCHVNCSRGLYVQTTRGIGATIINLRARP